MPLSYDTENPDSLQTLLQKARAIFIINEENIAHIQARKGQQVTVRRQYTLQTKTPPKKKQKKQHVRDHDNDMFQLVDNTTIKNVDEIIAAWRYHGGPLTKEKIAMDDFINRKLVRFSDVVRLHDGYRVLLDTYSRLLTDQMESRLAVEGVMRNMELLQVAIGEIHQQLLDTTDPHKVSNTMALFMKELSKSLKSFHSKVSGVGLNVDLKSNVAEAEKDADINSFDNCTTLTCKHTLSGHGGIIWALQPYELNDKQYLASGSRDNTIKLWDLSSNTVAATLTGHTGSVYALALYVQNGIQMLASGSKDNSIKLWNLLNNTNVHTLSGHADSITSLVIYEKGDKSILISGSGDFTIKAWDLDNNITIATLEGHRDSVFTLSLYQNDDKMYLASGCYDNSIKIWNLEDYTLAATLINDGAVDAGDGEDNEEEEDGNPIQSLVVVKHNEQHILASGDHQGKINLWNVENYLCIGTIQAHSSSIQALDVLKWNGKPCLVSGSEGKTIKVWDLENRSVVTTLGNDSNIHVVLVFMKEDRPCLASGDDANMVKLWME